MNKSIGLLAAALGLVLTSSSALASSAAWLANPSSGDWNTAANWTMGGPPNSPADIATFQSSSVTDISISRPSANTYVEVNGINFSTGGGTAYTLNVHEIYLSGSGITNDSGFLQHLVALGGIVFGNYARAGDNTAFTVNYGPGFVAPETLFYGHSSAGTASFMILGSTLGDYSMGGTLGFTDRSSAENATIVANGTAFRHYVCPQEICIDYPFPNGAVFFDAYSTAANATLIANGGINGGDGGVIGFGYRATGGTARVKVFGNGFLSISHHYADGAPDNSVTIGSLEGDGLVYLGAFPFTGPLIVGSNDLSTDFSGVISDGDGRPGGGGGTNCPLTKTGTGILTLSGTNTYTGAATINGGMLKVEGSITSAVTVNNGGTLGGSGTTLGVTVNSGGTVAPGGAQPLHVNGQYGQSAAGVLKIEVADANPAASGQLDVTGNAALDGTLEVRFLNGFLPVAGQVFRLFHVQGSSTGSFAQVIFPDLRAGFQFQTEFVDGYYQITALNDGVPGTGFLNISTRMRVGTGDNALIGGFIVTGNASKKVILRAIGPSLAPLPGRLSDPTLELRDNAGGLLFSNDNWVESPQAQQIIDSGIPPGNDDEAAIMATLAPGNYTAIMRGVNNTTGIGVVEVYDLAADVSPKLANISSRGFVETGDNVMIGGFIAGNQATHVMVRALGPSLTQSGVPNALADPTLELHNAQGAVIAFNNDWQETDQAAIEATGIPPTNDSEAAVLATLAPGNYTAIVRGLNDTTGVGLVEVYHLQ